MREPLPIYCDTSAAWAEACRQGGDPLEASTGTWKSAYEFAARGRGAGTRDGPRWGTGLRRVCCGTRRARTKRPGWEESEVTRFGRLARRLWDGMLDHEQMQER